MSVVSSASLAPPLRVSCICASTLSRFFETTEKFAPSSATFAESVAPSGTERNTVSSTLLERARARSRRCRIRTRLAAVALATVTTQSGEMARHAACTSATMVSTSCCAVACTATVHFCVSVTVTSAPLLALACLSAIASQLAFTSLELRLALVGSDTLMLTVNEVGGNGGGA